MHRLFEAGDSLSVSFGLFEEAAQFYARAAALAEQSGDWPFMPTCGGDDCGVGKKKKEIGPT